jgi:hypothetical protein
MNSRLETINPKLNRAAKIGNVCGFLKFFALLILGSIQGIGRHIDFWLAFITMSIKPVTASQQECNNAKDLQIKQEYRRIDPAISEIF